jgi:hypothetical protein
MQTHEIKAVLTCMPTEEKDYLKCKSCVVSISVGSQAHEGEKFRATIKMVNKYFQKCIIVMGDTLQRHTMASNFVDKTADDLRNLSEHLGDEWLGRNFEAIKDELKIPYEIVRWDHWLNDDKFPGHLEIVKNLYTTNQEFKSSVDETIEEFMKRYKSRNPNLNEQKIIANSLNYLLEECACMLQLIDLGYDYEVYTSKRTRAMSVFIQLVEPIKSLYLLKFAQTRFDEMVKKSEANFDTIATDHIVRTIPGHIYWKNKQGVYLGGSLQQAKSYGLKEVKDLLGKTDFDFLEYKEAHKVRANDLAVMRSGVVQISEESAVILGKYETFISYKTAIKDQDGAVMGILGVSLNITKQKEAEEKLASANKKLHEAMKAKTTFLHNLTHEIRTPLSCIFRSSQLLYDAWDEFADNEARKAQLKIALDSNKRLQSVINNLLDLSKNQAGKMNYNIETHSIEKSVRDVISEFITYKDLINFDCDMPPGFSFEYDSFRIEQVIRNLLANAIIYGAEGNINISISQKGNDVVFSIKDQGIGIPESELEKIFDVFAQSSKTNATAGTGIGLSICKKVIHDHGGNIWARNNFGEKGSNFFFSIPIDRSLQSSNYSDKKITNAELNDAYSTDAKGVRKKPTMLLIDDDQSILQVSKLVFTRMGFDMLLANSAQSGLDILQANPNTIKIVLLDVMLQDLSGLELLRIIKENPKIRHIPVYMHSGISIQSEIDEAISLGAVGFIDKTASIEEVSSILAKFLR